MTTTFGTCLDIQQIQARLQPMHIDAAFAILVSRLDAARHRGATEPLTAISTRAAGPNSRAATQRMLDSLGYSIDQRRIVHRLLAGSTSGWPGLIRLYANQATLSPQQRRYVLRQACSYTKTSAADAPRP